MKEAFVEVPAKIYIQYYIKEKSTGITWDNILEINIIFYLNEINRGC